MSKIRIGLLAYSSNTGLGVQTQEFAEHINPHRVLLVDLSTLNGMEIHHERFADFDCVITQGFPTIMDIDRFLTDLDVVFVCETPLNYLLFEMAHRYGVRTILQPNHEFNDYHNTKPRPIPDLFALPSPWCYDALSYSNKILLPVPVAQEKFPQQDITQFRKFLHIAGRPAVHDRNGTTETIAAFRALSGFDMTLTIRIQDATHAARLRAETIDEPNIIIDDTDIPNYWDAYAGFDCLIMPRKYGGLCLPMQEALGSGMPVIMTDVSPNNEILPADWLVAANRVGGFMARTKIDIFTVDTIALVDKVLAFYNMTSTDVAETQQIARDLGTNLSWQNQKSKYLRVFDRLVDSTCP